MTDRLRSGLAALGLPLVLAACGWLQPPARSASVGHFEKGDDNRVLDVEPSLQPHPYFVVDGQPFCFAGANNYYLMYKSEAAVLDLLDAAQEMGLRVLRTWAFLDRGSLDGSVRNIRQPGHKDGVYFQYWDPEAGRPAYNDGPQGLARLDLILHEARKRGLKLILTMTNGWRDFGGMDQYLVWYGLDEHHLFYTDPRVKRAYKLWVRHLIGRVNSIDGVPYREDPAIFAWELANEPRTMNLEDFDSAEGWDETTITEWADEMSRFVRSLDPHHMIAVGDEGFLSGGGDGWPYATPFGVDHAALTALPEIDFGTFHLYPDHWRTGEGWGVDWIEAHLELSRRLDKPVVLEEYGLRARRKRGKSGPISSGGARRQTTYENWNEWGLQRGLAGSLFWILSGIDDDGKQYPDYDHFTVYRDDDVWSLLRDYAERFATEAQACRFATGGDHGPASPFVRAHGAP